MSSQTERNGKIEPEVGEKPTRRRFAAEYKARILDESEQCTERGQLGQLLRREGLYSSHLSTWRSQRDAGLQPKRRGRKAVPNKQDQQELERLKRENRRLAERLRQAEIIIDVQKKVCQMLGIAPAAPLLDENDE